jgi:hypothetical protein
MKKPAFSSRVHKFKDPVTRKLALVYVLLVSLALLVVLLALVVKVTRDELRTESAIRRSESNSTVMRMIREAIDNLYQPALIEPKEQKQYIHELHVRFPVTSEADRILAGLGSSATEVEYSTVTSRYLMATAKTILNIPSENDPNAFLSTVPEFQKCVKPFLIQYQQKLAEYVGEYVPAGSKQLANGKTLYVFRSTACHSKYFEGDKYTKAELDRLQAQILQVESY